MTAGELLEEFRGLSRGVRSAVASGLALGDGPLRLVGNALISDLDDCSQLAELQMRVALRRCSYDEALIDRLEGVSEAPWPSVLAAVRATR
jgi:hypothetical protein